MRWTSCECVPRQSCPHARTLALLARTPAARSTHAENEHRESILNSRKRHGRQRRPPVVLSCPQNNRGLSPIRLAGAQRAQARLGSRTSRKHTACTCKDGRAQRSRHCCYEKCAQSGLHLLVAHLTARPHARDCSSPADRAGRCGHRRPSTKPAAAGEAHTHWRRATPRAHPWPTAASVQRGCGSKGAGRARRGGGGAQLGQRHHHGKAYAGPHLAPRAGNTEFAGHAPAALSHRSQ